MATTSPRKRLSSGVGIRCAARSASDSASTQQPLHVAAGHRRRGQHLGRSRSLLRARGARSWSRSNSSPLGQVPLVEHERGRAAGLHRQLGDPQVLRGDAVVRVADDERDVGALGRPLGAQRRVVLDRLLDLRLAPDAGGVDEPDAGGRRPRVACRSRRASCPPRSETITRSRPRKALTSEDLPTFGRPITASRTRSSSRPRRPPSSGGSSSTSRSSRSPVPRPWAAETGIGSPSPSAVEVVRERRGRAASRSCSRRRRPARRRGAGCRRSPRRPGRTPGARVDDEQRDLGVGERRARLVLDRDGERVLVVEVDAAGVDQRERAPVPVGLELLAVARDARAARARPPRATA